MKARGSRLWFCTGHAGIAIAQVVQARQAQNIGGVAQFLAAQRAQPLIFGQMFVGLQHFRIDRAHFAARGAHVMHIRAFTRVLRNRAARAE